MTLCAQLIRLAYCCVALLLICCLPARAQFVGPYLQLQAGGFLPDVVEADALSGTFNLEFGDGLNAAAAVGYELDPSRNLGKGRIELAYGYLAVPLENVEFSDGTAPAGGDLIVQLLLFNIWGNYRTASRWTPYYGGGLGLGRVDADGLEVTGEPLVDDQSYGLAYQLGLGIDYQLSGQSWLDLGYRYLGVANLEFKGAAGGDFEAHLHGHSLLLGLRFGF